MSDKRTVSDLEVIDVMCDKGMDVRVATTSNNLIKLDEVDEEKSHMVLGLDKKTADKIKDNKMTGVVYFFNEEGFTKQKSELELTNNFNNLSAKTKLRVIEPRISVMITMIKDMKLNMEKYLIPKKCIEKESMFYEDFITKYKMLFPKE